ncbi:ribosomal RNA large subunit methyltransferase E [Buchnera aphidicola]|uniref:Ribosomal RNA large subunit methyltransferase E n=1 Tax=Buchnera aphidicola subsp. Cinara cedri (strain Cc) TaxID=372461 RepID=RLME_BUCCC|nr:ribosomal RNA large subunit methyltransferase E [Buchnera aphidicola]Q057J5.1 RecName: Full=Ribosomal RNA large subunit methyltransferase E; AltName: Full=23S rRNA Um2552 methyltransferase; AltName: Full=rRNA (uridine-2'-O-)-methyltransferase [Buchnera aphidicola BCc]ABJ90704.1 ribosomal methytransferase [Buchnera aphidicola BCc]
MILKKRSKSSKNWLKRNFNDPYIKERNKKKLRSRSWFKLKEIDESEKIFKKGMNVIDLGSNPGGWSEYTLKKIGKSGKIFACDILPMRFLKDIVFFCGDISNSDFLKKIFLFLDKYSWNVVMSDISPNICGYSVIDNSNMFKLSNIVLKISRHVLSNNGYLIIKLFQGYGFNKYMKKIRNIFELVKIYKPNASRVNSREVFIIAYGCKK